jgi:hypothetical protein
MVTKDMEVTTCIEVIISIDGIFPPLPYTGNFHSIHRNTSMADYDSVSFFAVYGTCTS